MDGRRRPGSGFGRHPSGAYPPPGASSLGPPVLGGGCGGNRPVSASRRKGMEQPPSSSLWAKAGGSAGGLTRQASAPSLAPSGGHGGHNMSFDAFARSPPQSAGYDTLANARGTSMRRALSAASIGPPRSGAPSGQRPGVGGTSSVPRRRPYDHGPPPPVYATPERGQGNNYQQHRAAALQLESRLSEQLREQSIFDPRDPGRRPPVPDLRSKPGSRGIPRPAQTGSPWVNDSYSHASLHQSSLLDRDRRANTPSPGSHYASPWPEQRRPMQHQQPPSMPVLEQQPPPEAHYGRPPPPAQSSFQHYEGANAMPSQHSLGPDESGVMPESPLQIYSDLFEEVIDRDRVFGSLLRKIKTAYDSFLVRQGIGEQEIPRMPHDAARQLGGPPQGAPHLGPSPARGDSSWAPELSSSGLFRQPYGQHSNEPTRRDDGGQGFGFEMHRENRGLKDLVERLHLELEEAVKREHRWKQKVSKLKSRGDSVGPHSRPDSTGNTPSQLQAYAHSQQDPWANMGYPKEIMQQYEEPLDATQAPKMASMSAQAPKFHAARREPGLPQHGGATHDGSLNQGGLLSLSSISPQASANPGPESVEYDAYAADTARSTDSGMLPQKPTRLNVIKPSHVPMLDLTLLKQHEEEDEEDEEQGDGAEGEGMGDEDQMMDGDHAWSVDLAVALGAKIGRPDNGAIQRLDESKYSSMTKSVEALNKGIINCPEGLCIVYSNSNQMYFLLVRVDREADGIEIAREVFNIDVEQEDGSEDGRMANGHDDNDLASYGFPTDPSQPNLQRIH